VARDGERGRDMEKWRNREKRNSPSTSSPSTQLTRSLSLSFHPSFLGSPNPKTRFCPCALHRPLSNISKDARAHAHTRSRAHARGLDRGSGDFRGSRSELMPTRCYAYRNAFVTDNLKARTDVNCGSAAALRAAKRPA